MPADYERLGDRIRLYRESNGFSQETLAEKTNLSRENINRFENASRKPGIDAIVDIANALGVSIEDLLVDSLEHPISSTESEIHRLLLDCNKIEEAGIVEQQADKEFYVVKQRIKVMDENTGSSLIVLPDDDFSIDTMIEFDSPVLPNQFASLNSLKDFKTEIASSRTFVFVREIQPLVENNLIKGGDLDNAIVIYDKKMTQEELDKIADIAGVPHTAVDKLGYLNHKPLTHPNEPARHKLLDVMGDLALIGRPLKGRIVATRPGHTINTKLSNQIRKELRYQNVQAPVYNPNVPPVMDINRIRELLPHRYPMQLVDKVIEISDNYIVGVKNVTSNEPFFQGHFPEEPVMPGVLQIEAMAQVGGLLVLNGIEHPETYSTYFMKIDNVKFRQKVVPGDTLIFHISFMTPMRRGCAVMKGYAFVGEKIVSEVEFMAQIIKNK